MEPNNTKLEVHEYWISNNTLNHQTHTAIPRTSFQTFFQPIITKPRNASSRVLLIRDHIEAYEAYVIENGKLLHLFDRFAFLAVSEIALQPTKTENLINTITRQMYLNLAANSPHERDEIPF